MVLRNDVQEGAHHEAKAPLRCTMQTWDALQVLSKRVAPFLLEANGDPSSSAGQQVTELVAKFCWIFAAKTQLNPKAARASFFYTRSSATLLSQECWQAIIDGMSLTNHQQKELLKSRRLYLARQGHLLRVRKTLIFQLQVVSCRFSNPCICIPL